MDMGDCVHLVGCAVASDFGAKEEGILWMRRGDVRRRCGLGKDILDLWVSDGKVEAHKLNPGRNGTVIFSAEDIERTIKESPRYVPEKFSQKGVTSPLAK